MKNYLLIFIHLACAIMLVTGACSNSLKSKLEGNWKSKDGHGNLKVTNKSVYMDSDEAEDYVVKGDTLLTSYQGNQPYTPFLIRQLDEHNLKLLSPDSVLMEYTR